jgi:hypothetical protein
LLLQVSVADVATLATSATFGAARWACVAVVAVVAWGWISVSCPAPSSASAADASYHIAAVPHDAPCFGPCRASHDGPCIQPNKPTDNAFIESFNGKFRAECLNTHWFMTLDDAQSKMEEWRRDYNEVRPHSAIGNIPPITLMNGSKMRKTS